jgi:hypothetical protein
MWRRWLKRVDPALWVTPLGMTLIGALGQDGWLTLRTKWKAVKTDAFVQWVRRSLAPHLRRGDTVVLDNFNQGTQSAGRPSDHRTSRRHREVPAAQLARFQSDRSRVGR